MRGCSGGYMYHLFDKDTHRCTRCGRWQAGYAPKKEFKKPRAECQICERMQACDKNGTLGHHGYLRPGWGSIYNDCAGEGHKPFPATDALEAWLRWLDVIEKNLNARIADLEAGKVESLPFTYARDAYAKRQKTTVQVKPGAESYYDKHAYVTVPSFDVLRDRAIADARRELSLLPAERKRVTARIEKAKALTK